MIRESASVKFRCAFGQAAVDRHARVIVAAAVTQQVNDKKQLVPMWEQVKIMTASQPQQATADSGYFSEANVTDPKLEGFDLLVALDRHKHGEEVRVATGLPVQNTPGLSPTASAAQTLRAKLNTPQGRAVYKMRQTVVEPVFGQIKEPRGFRRFLLRGLKQVEGEWHPICATHNLLKLYQRGGKPQVA